MDENKEIAYLREFVSIKQCELMFPLKVQLDNVGLLQEEVRAVRQATDTVGSLLQHIVNKINKSIKKLKTKQNTCENEESEVEIKLALKNGQTQKPLKSKMVLKNLITSNMKDVEFSIFNQRYTVLINAPFVKEIKLPVILYSNFSVQASRCHVLFAENNASKFSWYKSKDKENWTKVADSYRYKTVDDDVGHYLKLICVPCNNVLKGPPAEVISENKVEKIGDLPSCPFEKRHKYTSQKLDDDK
ncbi:hypothetical protein BDFB_005507 [Asbolus verrucosus]|uniref:2',5'-phosphodiesterase 12-like N-terminal domain-containing protein n=1 Tax=Asbolus verrucosus TaxID=1661398 RepID=A0A482W049_ASBVE|nr:hypothetical protein BDFB_005507 [Asbolus verrucosus]